MKTGKYLPSAARRLQGDAFRSGAVGRMRGFASVSDLLRTLLLHVGNGYSCGKRQPSQSRDWLRCRMCDPRSLQTAGPWWRLMCARLLEENGMRVPNKLAVACSAPPMHGDQRAGKTGSSWRIHYTLRLPDLECDHFEITPARAKAERDPVAAARQPGDCFCGSRLLPQRRSVGDDKQRASWCTAQHRNLPSILHRPALRSAGAVGGLPEAGNAANGSACARRNHRCRLRLCAFARGIRHPTRAGATAPPSRQAGHTPNRRRWNMPSMSW